LVWFSDNVIMFALPIFHVKTETRFSVKNGPKSNRKWNSRTVIALGLTCADIFLNDTCTVVQHSTVEMRSNVRCITLECVFTEGCTVQICTKNAIHLYIVHCSGIHTVHTAHTSASCGRCMLYNPPNLLICQMLSNCGLMKVDSYIN